ncbi:hypothetical protein BJX61DRAFT_63335 [Aspergillus egyptiacus]|nr:hypothetical protein BJX61DRAFT_63335 [Aspergillus egyptiacus]
MTPFPALLVTLFGGKVRRQSNEFDPDTVHIPRQCYDACNAAALEAQAQDKSPALCEPGSDYMVAHRSCEDCIWSYLDELVSSSEGPEQDVVPLDLQFLGYCDDRLFELLAFSSLLATQSALQESPSSTGYNFTTPTPTPRVESTPPAPPPTTTDSARQTETTAEPDSSESTPTQVIVPAVVVPVVSLALAAASIWFLIRRRHKRSKAQQAMLSQVYEEDKPQLHADSIRPELDAVTTARAELDQDSQVSGPAELPAREPVGAEMEAGRD